MDKATKSGSSSFSSKQPDKEATTTTTSESVTTGSWSASHQLSQELMRHPSMATRTSLVLSMQSIIDKIVETSINKD